MGLGRHGDAVYSQEELDRVISDLIEQTTISGAPGPASAEAIRALPKKIVDKTMLGSDGKAECSICMDGVELQQEVTELPCKHWFHETCISAWLREHDTCPHCRRGITDTGRQSQGPQDSSASASSSSLPRSGGRSGSGSGSGFGSGFGSGSGSRSNPWIVPDSSPRPNNTSNNSGNGRFTGWVRQHFGGGSSHNHHSGGNSGS